MSYVDFLLDCLNQNCSVFNFSPFCFKLCLCTWAVVAAQWWPTHSLSNVMGSNPAQLVFSLLSFQTFVQFHSKYPDSGPSGCASLCDVKVKMDSQLGCLGQAQNGSYVLGDAFNQIALAHCNVSQIQTRRIRAAFAKN